MKKKGIQYIARHGETDSNSEDVFRGWDEVPQNQLTPNGRNEAVKLGEAIKEIVDCNNPQEYIIVTSDLRRARESGEIASEVSGIQLGKSYKELRSMDTGHFSHLSVDKYGPIITKLEDEYPNDPLPGGEESFNEFIAKIKNAFSKNGPIERDYGSKCIIVITHHQVEVQQAAGFKKISKIQYDAGIDPGEIRPI